MADTREGQIATWTKMRRGGKVRYVAMRGLASGACVAAALVVVEWIKTGTLTATIEAAIGFVIVGLMSAAQVRSEWNKLASIYPDIGIDCSAR